MMPVLVSRRFAYIYPADIPILDLPVHSLYNRNGETKTRLISYIMTTPVWLLGTPLSLECRNIGRAFET